MWRSALGALIAIALVGCAPQAGTPRSDPRLDTLFHQLQEAPSAAGAAAIERQIWQRWSESGSATVDVLMERALAAQSTQDFDRALGFLDEASKLQPGFAEPWNRKAAIAYDQGDSARALAAIQEVLKREPRHFGALMAMGVIAEGQGQTAAALEAYRTALRHHPYLEGARAGVARLAPKIDGRDT